MLAHASVRGLSEYLEDTAVVPRADINQNSILTYIIIKIETARR